VPKELHCLVPCISNGLSTNKVGTKPEQGVVVVQLLFACLCKVLLFFLYSWKEKWKRASYWL